MPRKHCTTRVRTRKQIILTKDTKMVPLFGYLQDTPDWTKWNSRTISLRKAEQMLSAGEVQAISRKKDGVVQIVGYQALQPTLVQRPSPATLTLSTMEAVANATDSRLSRAEAAQVFKFKVWPLIGDTKAVAVRPRISVRERIEAEALLKAA